MTRNLVFFFATTFITMTAFDLATTWIGVIKMGYTETNPYSDLSSVEGLVIPEIITLFIGMFMVALGAHYYKITLLEISGDEFIVFRKIFLSRNQLLPCILIFMPIFIAVLRSVAVFNNSLLIVTGYGLFVDEQFSLLSRNQFVMFVCAMLLIHPTVYLIYRVCRASTGSEAERTSPRRPRDQ